MAKDEQLHIFILIAFLLDIASSSLYLPHESMTRKIGETFIVVCKDDTGLPVKWQGPKGWLNGKTHPQVQLHTYGTVIFFDKAKKEDTGNYTCISQQEGKVFSLIVEEYIIFESTTDRTVPSSPRTQPTSADTTPTTPTERDRITKKPNSTNEDDGQRQISSTTIKHDTEIINSEIDIETTEKPEEYLSIVNTPEKVTTLEGKDIILKCQVNLREPVDITWSTADGSHFDTKYSPTAKGLYIPKVSIDDAKTFVCQAHHRNSGQVTTRNIELIVQHKPVLPYNVYAEEEEVYGFAGELVNLTCQVLANPPPIFFWKHNNMGTILDVSSHISVLEINVTEESLGTYECIASNALGELNKYFDLLLGEHPESPTDIELVSATDNSLEIKVVVSDIPMEVKDPVMDPQWIVVEYRPVKNGEWQSIEVNVTSESVLLNDLSNNTQYEIRAATKNVAGLSEYFTSDLKFQTSSAISVHNKSLILIYAFGIMYMFWIA